ncbi:MAG TPA: cytidylate kinase-like family protein [Solirubrobacteraceae bacterium]|nr:cytidylate kinase-like family protein [Solirubrobacteraceae bacterium]
MRYRTVCISSEDGTGALGAASLAARSLGLRVIDEDIVTKAAVEAGVDRDVVADVEQRKSKLTRLLEGLGPAGMGTTGYIVPEAAAYAQPPSDELKGLIRSVIEETAAAGGVMIVSHAASLALADREDVLRVFLTASPDTRRSRMAASLDLDENEAARMIKRSDAGRADYIKRFYGTQELPTDYDLVINTDRLTPEEASQLILQAAGGER